MSKRIIIVEGRTDRVALETLLVRVGLAAKEEKQGGRPWEPDALKEFDLQEGGNKDEAIRCFFNTLEHVRPRTIFLCVDLDDQPRETLFSQVEKDSNGILHNGVNGRYVVGKTVATIVPMGLPGLQAEWGITKFTIEDHIFKLILRKDAFDALKDQVRGHGLKIGAEHEKVIEKLKEVRRLLLSQNFEIMTSKAYLELFRGITSYIVSPATFVERVIENCPLPTLQETYKEALSCFRGDLPASIGVTSG